jgi:hypothetical protein
MPLGRVIPKYSVVRMYAVPSGPQAARSLSCRSTELPPGTAAAHAEIRKSKVEKRNTARRPEWSERRV